MRLPRTESSLVVKYRPPSYTLCNSAYHVGWEFIDESDCSSFLVVMDLLGDPFLWLSCSNFSFLGIFDKFLELLRFLFLVVSGQFLWLHLP